MKTRPSNPSGRLRADIGGRQFFTLAFGAIIGAGWVVVVGDWLDQAGPLGAMLAFAGGGGLMLLVGLCYAELVTMFPVSGGEVAYAHQIYGVKTCFALGWFLALAYISVTTFEALSVGWIAGALLPGIEGARLYTSGDDPVKTGSLLCGLAGMLLLTLLNYRGVKPATRFQDIFTYSLIALSLVFISAGLARGNLAHLEPLFRSQISGSAWKGVLTVLVTAPFWFAGFNVIPQVMEEKAGGTPLCLAGRMILLSIGLAMLFYCLVILSSAMTMPWQQLSSLPLPAAGAFEAAFDSSALARTVLLAAFLGLITTWNTVFISASRVLFALGRARIISPAFRKIHPVFGSPSTAVLFVGVVGSGGVFLGRRAIQPIVNVAATCLAMSFFLSCLGVMRLRRARPRRARPSRVPGGMPTAAVATLGSLLMVCFSLFQPYVNARGTLPLEWALLLGWGVLGALFWLLGHKTRGTVSEPERHKLILGTEAVTE